MTAKRFPVPGRATLLVALAMSLSGCGTTRWTDTQRTATEQLLISDAVDQAITQIDFSVLEGKSVFVDSQYLDITVVDKGYLISSVRQHLLASGCIIQEDRSKSTYVVEIRSGGIGTDRFDLLFGVPAMSLPTFLFAAPGVPTQTPEVALAKRTKQTGAAKVGIFAFNRVTGQPVWQSGMSQASSFARHTWVLGAGPFTNGTIRNGTRLAGEELRLPLMGPGEEALASERPLIPVTQQATWVETPVTGKEATAKADASKTDAAAKPETAKNEKPAEPAAATNAAAKAVDKPARVNLLPPESSPDGAIPASAEVPATNPAPAATPKN